MKASAFKIRSPPGILPRSSGNQRSGMNASGLGEKLSGLRWMAYGATKT